jgi:protein transport protein SEC61 subunit gamma-like protein
MYKQWPPEFGLDGCWLAEENDRKVFYSLIPSHWGMSEGTNDTEKKGFAAQKLELKNNKLDLKSKLNLDDMDLGVTMPSTNVNEYIRVLRLARKPSREEFNMIAKISMAGIGIIGTLGFVIYALLTELPKAF